MGKWKVWTEEEDEFLIDNFMDLTNQQLAISLDINFSAIRKRKKELGITNLKHIIWTKEKIDFLRFNSDKLSDNELSKILQIKQATISSARNRYGIKKNHSKIRKIMFKEGKIVHGMEGKKMPKEQIEKRLKTLFKNGNNVAWNRGLRGKEYLSHYKAGKVWSKGLTKETDERVRRYTEKSMKTKIENNSMPRGKSHYFYGKTKENSEWARRNSERMINGGAIRALSGVQKPSSYEKKISELCIENNLPFIYTGRGTFIIGGKNPDFVNQERKIVIEVFADYFKIREYGSVENYIEERGKYFARYGYRTIFIKENEITNKNWKNICLNKIIQL